MISSLSRNRRAAASLSSSVASVMGASEVLVVAASSPCERCQLGIADDDSSEEPAIVSFVLCSFLVSISLVVLFRESLDMRAKVL